MKQHHGTKLVWICDGHSIIALVPDKQGYLHINGAELVIQTS
jgi:hypothetical protein